MILSIPDNLWTRLSLFNDKKKFSRILKKNWMQCIYCRHLAFCFFFKMIDYTLFELWTNLWRALDWLIKITWDKLTNRRNRPSRNNKSIFLIIYLYNYEICVLNFSRHDVLRTMLFFFCLTRLNKVDVDFLSKSRTLHLLVFIYWDESIRLLWYYNFQWLFPFYTKGRANKEYFK